MPSSWCSSSSCSTLEAIYIYTRKSNVTFHCISEKLLHNDPLVPFCCSHCNQFKAEMHSLHICALLVIVTQRARATHSKRVNCASRRDRGKWKQKKNAKVNRILCCFCADPDCCQLLSMIFHRFVEWLLWLTTIDERRTAKRYKCIIIYKCNNNYIWV